MQKAAILFAVGYAFFLVGAASMGIAAVRIVGGSATGGPAGESADLNRRIDQLTGELAERDRIIAANQRQFQDSVDELIEYADVAGGAVERASGFTEATVTNLREASDLIRQGIKEREDLKSELNSLRAAVYRFRDLDWDEPDEIGE